MSRSKIALVALAACTVAGSAAVAAPLPAYVSTARADLQSETARETVTNGPASKFLSQNVPNPYAGGLGEPSHFYSAASAWAAASGGPFYTDTPFAFASSQSSGLEAKASATATYSLRIVSELNTSVLVDIHALFTQTIGYQANGEPVYGQIGSYGTSEVYLSVLGALNGEFRRKCAAVSQNCFITYSDEPIAWDNQVILDTNKIYTVSLLANTVARGVAPIGGEYVRTFASAYLDPYFSIAASVANPEAFAFEVSPGVQNVPGSTAPEPGVWALMLVGFGLAGGALRRTGRTARAS